MTEETVSWDEINDLVARVPYTRESAIIARLWNERSQLRQALKDVLNLLEMGNAEGAKKRLGEL